MALDYPSCDPSNSSSLAARSAACGGHADVLQAILDAREDVNPGAQHAVGLHTAIANNDYAVIRILLGSQRLSTTGESALSSYISSHLRYPQSEGLCLSDTLSEETLDALLSFPNSNPRSRSPTTARVGNLGSILAACAHHPEANVGDLIERVLSHPSALPTLIAAATASHVVQLGSRNNNNSQGASCSQDPQDHMIPAVRKALSPVLPFLSPSSPAFALITAAPVTQEHVEWMEDISDEEKSAIVQMAVHFDDLGAVDLFVGQGVIDTLPPQFLMRATEQNLIDMVEFLFPLVNLNSATWRVTSFVETAVRCDHPELVAFFLYHCELIRLPSYSPSSPRVATLLLSHPSIIFTSSSNKDTVRRYLEAAIRGGNARLATTIFNHVVAAHPDNPTRVLSCSKEYISALRSAIDQNATDTVTFVLKHADVLGIKLESYSPITSVFQDAIRKQRMTQDMVRAITRASKHAGALLNHELALASGKAKAKSSVMSTSARKRARKAARKKRRKGKRT